MPLTWVWSFENKMLISARFSTTSITFEGSIWDSTSFFFEWSIKILNAALPSTILKSSPTLGFILLKSIGNVFIRNEKSLDSVIKFNLDLVDTLDCFSMFFNSLELTFLSSRSYLLIADITACTELERFSSYIVRAHV